MLVRLLGYRGLRFRGWELWLEPAGETEGGLWFLRETGRSWRLNLGRVCILAAAPDDAGPGSSEALTLRVLYVPSSASRVTALVAQVNARGAAV